jgi:integrase/recombinase XerC
VSVSSADPLIGAYAAELRLLRKLSAHTCDAYVGDVLSFAAFLEPAAGAHAPKPATRSFPHLVAASNGDIVRFVMKLTGKNAYTAASVRRKLSALQSFYEYLRRSGRRPDNPATDVPVPKLAQRLPQVLEPQDVSRLLRVRAAGQPQLQRLRDAAIMELLYASGIRRGEAAALNLEDIDLAKRTLRVTGKRNKQRLVLINNTAADALRAYLSVRPRTSDPALFVGRSKRRLSDHQIWVIFGTFVKLSGIGKKATPHVMRHSFATHLLENGADLMTIKELLGHASLATTQIYTNLSLQHMRSTYDKAHPRDKDRAR